MYNFSVVVILTFVEIGGGGKREGVKRGMCINGAIANFVILSFKGY